MASWCSVGKGIARSKGYKGSEQSRYEGSVEVTDLKSGWPSLSFSEALKLVVLGLEMG